MGRSMVASLILRLRDLVSPGLGALQRRLQGVRAAAERIGAIGAVVAGISLVGPISQAAALEGRLRDVAITAGVARGEISASVNAMREEYTALAREFRESTNEVLGIAEVLTSRGLEADRVRVLTRELTEMRAATGAAGADLGQLAVGFERIAGLSGDQVRLAMARAMRAGQLGGFEMREMAGHLSGILATMGTLEVRGMRSVENASAMLQVVRDGFGTSEQAAQGLQQMLGQLFSESTIDKARELGVDLRGIFQDARRRRARGEDVDPVELLIQGLRAAGGGQSERFIQLLPDQNARQAFLGLLSGMDRYVSIRRELRRTGVDVISATAAARMEGLAAEWRRFNHLISEFGDRLGVALGSQLARVNGGLERFRELIRQMDADFPGVIDQVGSVAAGATLLAGALGVLGVVGPAVAKGVGLLLSPLRWIWALLKIIAVGAVAIFGVKGAIALAVVAAVAAIFLGWDRVEPYFHALWNGVQGIFDEFGTWLSQWVQGEGQIAWLAGVIVAAWRPLREFFDGLFEGIGAAAQRLMGWLRPVLDAAAWILGTRTGQGALTDPAQQAVRAQRGSPAGFAAAAAGMLGPLPAQQQVRGEIVVRAAPGSEVEYVESGNRDIGLTIAPSRGLMLGVP